MQQHLMQMQPMMAAYYPSNVTTDHIQQYLDENKSLILKIVESQNSGKLNECAENQARLQRNLMYLAAIADSQPQPPSMHSQFPPTGIVQPGTQHYLQQQQAQQMASQSLMAARSSMLYGQQQFSALQPQQALNSQLGMSSSGVSAGLPILQGEAQNAGGSSWGLGSVGFPDFIRSPAGEGGGLSAGGRGMASGSKLEMLGGMSAEVRGGGSSGGGHNVDGSESLFLKSGDHDHGN